MSRPSTEKRVLPGKVRCRKRSKVSTSRDAIEQRLLVDGRHGRTEAARLDGDAQPLALFGDEDLREVVAGARAVGRPQRGDGRGGVGLALGKRSADDAGRELPELLLGDAMALGGEHRVTRRPRPQRVDLGAEVPVPPNPLRQRGDADHGPEVDRGGPCGGGHRRLVGGRPLLEVGARLRVDCSGILPVPVVQLEHVPGIQPLKLVPSTHTESRFYRTRHWSFGRDRSR